MDRWFYQEHHQDRLQGGATTRSIKADVYVMDRWFYDRWCQRRWCQRRFTQKLADVDVKDGFMKVCERLVSSTVVWLLTAAPCHRLKLSCH